MIFNFLGFRFNIRKISSIPNFKSNPRITPEPTEEASHQFWDAFQSGGVITAQCLCGRVHFSGNETLDWNSEEFENLIEQYREFPDKYIRSSNDFIGLADGPYGLMIWGCPCRSAKRLEDVLISFHREILQFYALRHEQQKIQYEREAKALDNLK